MQCISASMRSCKIDMFLDVCSFNIVSLFLRPGHVMVQALQVMHWLEVKSRSARFEELLDRALNK
jgi:hypothetical protein